MIIKKIRQPYFIFTKEQTLFMDNIYKKCKSPNYNELLLNIPTCKDFNSKSLPATVASKSTILEVPVATELRPATLSKNNSQIMTKNHIRRYFKNKRYRQKKKK